MLEDVHANVLKENLQLRDFVLITGIPPLKYSEPTLKYIYEMLVKRNNISMHPREHF